MGNAISSPKQCAASILQCGHLKQLAIDPAIECNRTTIIPPQQRQAAARRAGKPGKPLDADLLDALTYLKMTSKVAGFELSDWPALDAESPGSRLLPLHPRQPLQ
jgi:hypothetical protein